MRIDYGVEELEAINILSENNEEAKRILTNFHNEFLNIDPNSLIGSIRAFVYMEKCKLKPEHIIKLFTKCNDNLICFATLFRAVDIALITNEEFEDFLNDKITLDFNSLNKEIREFVKFKKT